MAALAASRFRVEGDLCFEDVELPEKDASKLDGAERKAVELELFEVVFISGGLTEPEVLVAVALGRVPEPDALFGRRFSELPTLDPNPGRLPEPVLGVFRSCLGVWIAKSPSLNRELSKGVFVPRPGR